MTPQLIVVLRAADAAARWHVFQRRKGALGEPYINHLLEVAGLVAEATEGADPELVIAALLHDSIEDQEVPREVIAAEFGARVAQVVEEVTDDKSLSKHQRKQRQVETAAEKSREAKILKLADKTSNLTEMERRLEYVQWARDVAAGLKGVCPSLEQKFDRAANEATLAAVAQRFTAKEHCNARLFPR